MLNPKTRSLTVIWWSCPGNQLTSVSNVEDVASMLAAVPGNTACIGQHYNASNGRAVTLVGIVKMLAKAVGKEPKIVFYNEKDVEIPKGKGFPFRYDKAKDFVFKRA